MGYTGIVAGRLLAEEERRRKEKKKKAAKNSKAKQSHSASKWKW